MVDKTDRQARDLAVAYRIYPRVAKPALGLPFSDDKLRLSEICLRSFKESLGSLRVKIWALLDGCTEEYADLFRKYFEAKDLVLVPLDGVGNRATFGKQIAILLEQQDSKLVYFAEDDYVYLPHQFPRMVQFLLAHDDVDFISPYDHLDCYTLEIHRQPKWIRVCAGHHWRTAASTCLTFLTRRQTLERNEQTFRTYCRQNSDFSLWLAITKRSLFYSSPFFSSKPRDRWLAKTIIKAWVFNWPQILFGKSQKLWVPVPGIATHLDALALSPTIDWSALMKEIAVSLEVSAGVGRKHGQPDSIVKV